MRTFVWVLVLGLSACGAAPVEPVEDVSAEWSAGDDAPLEASED